MTWRLMLAAAALLGLAACDAGSGKSGAHSAPATAPGYTLDVFARDSEQIYLVSDAHDHVAAARVVDHASSVIAPDEARSLLAERQAMFHAPNDSNNAVNIQAGGFSLKINGEGDTSSKEGGDAHIDINAGGHNVTIDAQGSDNNGRARVHISGADEASARKFITDADDLSQDVKTQMLHTLGL
ncbi:MAG: hypothetical protein ABUL73_01395 [Alphaproteobacteria bacterium]